MVNSFCGEFLLQSHAALHGEFLLVLHTLCWVIQGAPLAGSAPWPCWFIWGFSYMPSAGLYGEFLLHAQCWFRCGVSLTVTHPMPASLCSKFLLYKTKRKDVKLKVNKNVHNWEMLLFNFKAEVDIQCRLHKVASCLPADSAEINTNMKWVPVKQ